VTDQYKYLGVAVDSTLNLNSFFDTCYKKASSRLNLLAKLRYMLNTDASKSIYNSMILPTFTYIFNMLPLERRSLADKKYSTV